MPEPRLDPGICREFFATSSFHNTVITNESGRRKVNEMWPTALQSFRIQFVSKWKGTDAEKVARARRLVAFWYQMRGNSRCFRFKNWGDYQDWGRGRVILIDGVYRLVKDYHQNGDADTYTVKIYKPAPGTIVLSGGAAGGTVDYATGIVSGINSPGTWSGEYDLWVHFGDENIGQVGFDAGGILNWTGLSVMEELLED